MEIKELIIYFVIILILYSLLYGIATWKLFQLAGKKSSIAFIPILNFLTTLNIMKRPWWWILIIYIPIVGPILQIVILVDFLRCYNKKNIFDAICIIIFNIFYIAFINYKNNTKFIGVEDRKETLISSILFAIIFATLIHTYIIQPYTIPTSSMEKTLLIGDFLFVSKLHYGARIPMTPIALPFLQSKIPVTSTKTHNQINSYVSRIKLPYIRMPGWQKIKRYDIVTFNYPTDSSHTCIDRKDPYVKRCLGLPGDIIFFKNGRSFINKQQEKLPKEAKIQFSYIITVYGELSNKKIQNLIGISDFESYHEGDFTTYFFKGLTKNNYKKLISLPNIINAQEQIYVLGNKIEKFYNNKNNIKVIDSTYTIFPENKQWNIDQYGPLYIPKKGDIIQLNTNNITQYYNIISNYEGVKKKKIEIKNNNILINGHITKKYKIKQNYYFMVGDNRDSSLDSRFFGYVPEDHIIGKPVFIWLSLQGLFDSGKLSIRIKRMFKAINTGNEEKTWYFPHFCIIIIMYFFWSFYRSRKRKKILK